MFRLTLDNLRARKFRLVSTALSIMIGIAFLAGSLVLIDTIGRTFNDLLADITSGVDAEIRSSDVIETEFYDIRGRIDAGILDDVLAVEGVEAAAGSVVGYAQLVDTDGEPIGNPGQGAPTLGFGWTDIDELNPMVLVDGKAPTSADEIVIDRASAKIGPFAVGDEVPVLLQTGPQVFIVSGIATFGDSRLAARGQRDDLRAGDRPECARRTRPVRRHRHRWLPTASRRANSWTTADGHRSDRTSRWSPERPSSKSPRTMSPTLCRSSTRSC